MERAAHNAGLRGLECAQIRQYSRHQFVAGRVSSSASALTPLMVRAASTAHPRHNELSTSLVPHRRMGHGTYGSRPRSMAAKALRDLAS
eukprot:4001170-Pleurochrysis_carterae.AAC.2